MPAAKRYPGRNEYGQAMIEFAILALLLILLIAGGIELALAAFSSQRVADGAKNGVEAWIAAMAGTGVYGTDGPDFSVTTGLGLGNHSAEAGFLRPACDVDPSVYDSGLPEDSVTLGGDKVYLFNPRPIDTTLCTGQDGTDVTRSRISVLVDQLPKLNQAMYSLYQKRCADAGGAEISCSDTAGVAQTYLRLPGKLDPIDDRVYLAILDADPASPNFQTLLASRPIFEIECASAASNLFGACDTQDSAADICFEPGSGDPLACDVRIRTRARFIFHAFLQYPFVFWSDPLPAEALAQLDTGPAGAPPGSVGSEVARGNVRRFQRTFLGCWETLTVPPTAGMLGSRTTRACN